MFECKKKRGEKVRAYKDCPECPVRISSEGNYTCTDWLIFYNYVDELEKEIKRLKND